MGGIDMEILITGGAFLGAVLGRSFKVLILVPASAFVVTLLLIKSGFAGHPLFNSLVKIALLIASLELGYVTGLISTDISSAVQGFRGFWTRPRGTTPSRPAHLR
jgi:hypothetical protein